MLYNSYHSDRQVVVVLCRSLVAVAFVLCCTSGALGRSLLGSSGTVSMQAKTGDAKTVQDVYEAQVSPASAL